MSLALRDQGPAKLEQDQYFARVRETCTKMPEQDQLQDKIDFEQRYSTETKMFVSDF